MNTEPAALRLDRPAHACLLCPPPRPDSGRPWQPADEGYRTCSDCYDRLRERLAEITSRWARLTPAPGATGNNGGRGAPGFGSRAPASDHVIAMRDRRSSPTAKVWLAADGRVHAEHERPPLSVHNVLNTICWAVAEARDTAHPGPGAGVPDLARWIDAQLDWLTRHDLVAEVHRDLRVVLNQLRPATGDPGRRAIGACPNTVDTDDDGIRDCGARLYAPLRGDSIECGACGRIWPRSEWLRLGDLLQDAG